MLKIICLKVMKNQHLCKLLSPCNAQKVLTAYVPHLAAPIMSTF